MQWEGRKGATWVHLCHIQSRHFEQLYWVCEMWKEEKGGRPGGNLHHGPLDKREEWQEIRMSQVHIFFLETRMWEEMENYRSTNADF